jgi:AbrB family looped-hinge helix DNA binding protein
VLIGTWNMEWASPGTAESGAAQSQVESLGFDVFVGNEVTLEALPRGSHMVDGGLDWGYEVPLILVGDFKSADTADPAVILPSMTHRVGPKGQVVIPKELREEFGIESGDEVSFWRHGDHVAVRPARGGPPLLGRFRNSGLTAALEGERRADRERESSR